VHICASARQLQDEMADWTTLDGAIGRAYMQVPAAARR